jgi:hypothetical protein
VEEKGEKAYSMGLDWFVLFCVGVIRENTGRLRRTPFRGVSDVLNFTADTVGLVSPR